MLENKVIDFFYGKHCLVTGGTGLIGREVARILADIGAHVRVVSMDNLKIDNRVEYVKGDLTDFNFCLSQTKDTDYVFHIAGIKGSINVTVERPASFFVPLLMFNTNILEASRRNGIKNLVYTSSIGAYPSAEIFVESDEDETDPPMDMFPGWAKRMAELQIKAYQKQYDLTRYSIVRPCNVYGPGDNFDPENAMVIPSLMSRILKGEAPMKIWGDGSAVRDFAFSTDIAFGVIQALYYGTGGGYINLGSGVGVSIKELVLALKGVVDFEYEFDITKPSGFPKRVMDITRAREFLNYNPSTSLHDGLSKTWKWFNENQEEFNLKQNYFKE